jgi:putative transposase
MDSNNRRLTRLAPIQMEGCRLAATTLLRQGRVTQAKIAWHLGVSRASVSRWAATLTQEGRPFLKAQPLLGPSLRLNEMAWPKWEWVALKRRSLL